MMRKWLSMAVIVLYPGYVSQVRCEGRLLVSAIGSEVLVRLESLPPDLGCGVLLKPAALQGRTNLILETSSGTLQSVVEIAGPGSKPTEGQLSTSLRNNK